MERENENFNENENKGDGKPSTSSESHGNSATNLTERQWSQNFLTSASPPKFVSMDEIINAANGMKNMALAHEIAMDKNFILKKLEPEEGSVHRQIKEIMHKAFWSILKDQLEDDPPNYSQALILLQELRDSLEELILPHHTKTRENLREILDLDLIKQQTEKGVIDFKYYSDYILNVMSKICAPVRDDRIKELESTTDIVDKFRGIMELIQLMKLDLANFTITMMRPNIVASSIEYEKKKFAQFLQINPDGLTLTKRWILKHLDDDKIKQASNDTNGLKQVTYYLLTEAYLDLLNWDFVPDAETLMLDQGRLLELRNKINHLTIIGSILLICYNTVGASIQGVASFKKNIKEHLYILLENIKSNKELEEIIENILIQVKKDINTTLSEIGAPELPVDIQNILDGQIRDLVNENHKIRSLVNLRIRQFLQKIILSHNNIPNQVPPGLSSLQDELASIAARFFIIVAHNRSVFGEYYQDILAKEIDYSYPSLYNHIDKMDE